MKHSATLRVAKLEVPEAEDANAHDIANAAWAAARLWAQDKVWPWASGSGSLFLWFSATSQAQAQAAAGRPPGSASGGGSVRPRDAELLRGSAALLLRRLAPVARQRLKAGYPGITYPPVARALRPCLELQLQ